MESSVLSGCCVQSNALAIFEYMEKLTTFLRKRREVRVWKRASMWNVPPNTDRVRVRVRSLCSNMMIRLVAYFIGLFAGLCFPLGFSIKSLAGSSAVNTRCCFALSAGTVTFGWVKFGWSGVVLPKNRVEVFGRSGCIYGGWLCLVGGSWLLVVRMFSNGWLNCRCE